MVFIQETKKEEFYVSEIGRLWYDDDFDFKFSATVGRLGGLLTIWDKSKFKAEKSLITSRYIVILGVWVDENLASTCINVYAPCNNLEKRNLWEYIVALRSVWMH
ncbi:hypothetical protein GQ457_07G011510 [Hibiscus cannabinus]